MNQLADNKKLMDFLLYSYFGCKSNDLAREGMQKCTYRAYLDLNRRIGFYYSSSKLANMQKRKDMANLAKEYKEAKSNLVKEICTIILSPVGECQCVDGQFDSWHEAKCKEIKNIMNEEKSKAGTPILKENGLFTYGLAQKWVNMTLKYLWLLGMLPEGLTKKSLHVPIDSFILKKLQDENVDGISGSDGDTYKYRGESWSQLDDYSDYSDVQGEIERIARGISPIEWEASAWMDVAKTRSSK